MKIFGLVVYAAGIVFCIAAFMGHSAAYSGAALCFFAGTIALWVYSKKDHNAKQRDGKRTKTIFKYETHVKNGLEYTFGINAVFCENAL